MSDKNTSKARQQDRNVTRKGFHFGMRRDNTSRVSTSDRAALRSFARLGLLATSSL